MKMNNDRVKNQLADQLTVTMMVQHFLPHFSDRNFADLFDGGFDDAWAEIEKTAAAGEDEMLIARAEKQTESTLRWIHSVAWEYARTREDSQQVYKKAWEALIENGSMVHYICAMPFPSVDDQIIRDMLRCALEKHFIKA